MTRDDGDENEGDDDARRSSSALAYAKRRPPALALASEDKTDAAGKSIGSVFSALASRFAV